MHSALLVLLSFLGLYILQSLQEFRRAIRSVGWAPSPLQRNNEITESSFGSLSGPRVLITPLSPLGQLIRLVLPPFRYIIPDRSWVIKNGNRGRDMPGQEIICESLSYADFAAAGQDALAMVGLLYSVYGGARLNDRGCQVSVWPPRANIYLADAAAIKVRDTLPRTRSILSLICLQEVASSRARFSKPLKLYKVLSVFGGNIAASDGEDWKRYRAITAPAFSEVRHSCRCCHFLNTTLRKIFGWYGKKQSASCSTCSTMSGETVPKSCWITV